MARQQQEPTADHEHNSTIDQRMPDMAHHLGWSPFHTAADDYYHAGYLPIPLPEGKKFPPPNGTPNDVDYTEGQLEQWLSGIYTRKNGTTYTNTDPRNIGTIVPEGLVLLDVDGRPGLDALVELEARYGELPATWAVFRGDPNRFHMWFSVPTGLRWPGRLAAGLDIVYRHYRYAVLPPSVHPDGGVYRWAFTGSRKSGGALRLSHGYFPGADEFTDLPEAWLQLADSGGFQHRERAEVDARLWLQEFGKGEPCPELIRVAKQHRTLIRKHADLGGLHDALVNAVWAILAEISQGHAGGYRVLRTIRDTFLAQADASGRREEGAPEAEWSRAIIGAIEKTAVEPVRQGDPCTIEEAERGKDPDRFFDGKHGLLARRLRTSVERTGKLAVGPGKIIYRYTAGIWTPDGEGEIYRRTERLLRERYRPSHAANVLSVVSNREPTITDDKQDTQYLNLPNGLLDWSTGNLIPHSPHVISTNRIPIPWDDSAECPEVDQFFREVFPGDAIELAYEILGYMLFNDNPLHKAILLYGSGRNGKGTFIRLARMLVGHANISAVTPQALDSSKFSSAQLYGKLANLVGDVDPRIFKSTEQFKQLTGGDYMQGEHKYGHPFDFRCRALMVAAFNALPRTADTTEGFFSRWVVVPFDSYFPAGKADPTLIEHLSRPSVLQGVLRAAVGGLQNVMRRGAFHTPPSVIRATDKFRKEADPLRAFIDARIDKRDPAHSPFVARSDFYLAYQAWAVGNGYHTSGASVFYEKLITSLDHPVRIVRNHGTDGYRGILIK